MRLSLAAILLSLSGFSRPQQIGHLVSEDRPKIYIHNCTKAGGCTKTVKHVTVDANWRPFHDVNGKKPCLSKAGKWDPVLCPDELACAKNCALEGVDYARDIGVNSTGEALNLKLVTNGALGKNVGSRLYLLDRDGKYVMLKLKNQEFSFEIDVSELPCGVNGALYLSAMDADGGASSNNKAASSYGTGYCDAQCPHAVKFLGGKVNMQNWTSTGPGTGNGRLGSCCTELDIWEANTMSQAFTLHPCKTKGPTQCTDKACSSLCDGSGCDFASYRLGAHDFYGPHKTIDTTKKFSVVTQFITHDGTSSGSLVEIRRLYVQNGRVIQNSKTKLGSLKPFDSITKEFCKATRAFFNETNVFQEDGGMARMGAALERGMVLTFSLWDDHSDQPMLWLDGQPDNRGTCTAQGSNVTKTEEENPGTSVKFSNIRVGDLNTTFPFASSATGRASKSKPSLTAHGRRN
ncbi:hypothetical protein CROQUDRAFT_89151 [Cronartium quercuum f. sp. fusiforme G11]|uniref:Glucanase n=1 Tax=Cronartium quercuum f. sp. fusiforme G11 TaxID=708437 RepID=A0A9P6NLL8_9BASI|nr:hypothetical protein CROQUDRAFT_89151 [Cronartium quercuum f. sp. fusiforme G11]